ncbi:hypothetical protein P3T20_003390 [Paraburkholderia sp. GAS206C]
MDTGAAFPATRIAYLPDVHEELRIFPIHDCPCGLFGAARPVQAALSLCACTVRLQIAYFCVLAHPTPGRRLRFLQIVTMSIVLSALLA